MDTEFLSSPSPFPFRAETERERERERGGDGGRGDNIYTSLVDEPSNTYERFFIYILRNILFNIMRFPGDSPFS